MSKQPMNVYETTMQIIEVGIDRLILVGSKQGHLPNSPSGCKFWVEVKGTKQSVVIETPDGSSQAFLAMANESFGIPGQPSLNNEQQAVVDQLASEVKKWQNAR